MVKQRVFGRAACRRPLPFNIEAYMRHIFLTFFTFAMASASLAADNKLCSAPFLYSLDLLKRAEGNLSAGNCSESLAQLQEAAMEWKNLSTNENCSRENKDSALENLRFTQNRYSKLRPKCSTYVEWREKPSKNPESADCKRGVALATEDHRKAINLALSGNCPGAIALFNTVERQWVVLAKQEYCSTEMHELSESGKHRIRYDKTVLYDRYCRNTDGK